ncbi:DUF3179 domain-containing (seleno)protein [Spirosoma utsteinense]|uniref:DUF3179 domain-containing protein n=1 Tax=Spirosoma utsteinense TaxID=2585773 RepID=A0ABR6W5U3_9BACT|nr:DUF3179 domain-containing (seleno)protein [Spirosoma utsteinense]MBC3787143.1 hypothetical protein [Spirosoma utsteinense]MBC3791307.1 hypothetical protein [Spirosoma utsteinense]
MIPRIWKPVCLLLVLMLLEVARVYFIMPFPGSQLDDTANLSRVQLAYWLHQYAPWVRLVGILALIMLVAPVLARPARPWHRGLVLVGVLLYAAVLYMVNEQMMADRMFQQPRTKRLVSLSQNRIPMNKLVLGLIENGDARAYPLQLIGYHHQVRDTIGGKPVMITYCTVCRTGRVFDPVVAGKPETFRLVGMDHFNAMFEDERTGSWWRQATGEAILGPQKGQILTELPARQMTLAAWSGEHPTTLVMQPDPAFKEETDSLATYDLGLKRGKLTGRDVASWHDKSWVVGVLAGGDATAFDWNDLAKKRLIQHTVGGQPVVLMMAPDSLSFGAFSRQLGGQTLTFSQGSNGWFSDVKTGSVWNAQGRALSGPLAGQQLSPVRAYQEFWHSWRSFHPATRQLR